MTITKVHNTCEREGSEGWARIRHWIRWKSRSVVSVCHSLIHLKVIIIWEKNRTKIKCWLATACRNFSLCTYARYHFSAKWCTELPKGKFGLFLSRYLFKKIITSMFVYVLKASHRVMQCLRWEVVILWQNFFLIFISTKKYRMLGSTYVRR